VKGAFVATVVPDLHALLTSLLDKFSPITGACASEEMLDGDCGGFIACFFGVL
jgi:hypothetical protein